MYICIEHLTKQKFKVMKKVRISRAERKQNDAKFLNDLYNSFSNLTKEEQILRRADLLINPILCTYGIGSDSYRVCVSDFQRNGKTIIIQDIDKNNNIKGNIVKKFTWSTKLNNMEEYPSYRASKGSYGYLTFGICEDYRDRSF
ncbi:MAG: hypothetical protein Unbinned2903contig1001_44 [Prokaryotic dsDNA virus sp.]|nr:MAG: hypothetical protein Unbinned2903contig1001_44 [Prokaryotic dsDNA virus sp.]